MKNLVFKCCFVLIFLALLFLGVRNQPADAGHHFGGCGDSCTANTCSGNNIVNDCYNAGGDDTGGTCIGHIHQTCDYGCSNGSCLPAPSPSPSPLPVGTEDCFSCVGGAGGYCTRNTVTAGTCTTNCSACPGGSTPTPSPAPASSCTVTWSTVPSTIKPNTNFTATITRGTSNVGWNNVMVYKDNGVAVPGGTVVTGGYTWVVNSGSQGGHWLTFSVNSPHAGSSGPITYCTPIQSFSTINWPTASVISPSGLELESGKAYTFSATANGTNMVWVRTYRGLKSAVDSHISSPQASDWTLIAENHKDRTDGKVCESTTQCSTGSLDPWTPAAGKYYVIVRANQADGAGNAMPCGGDPHLDGATGSSATSGWSDCGPSDRLTVDVSDVTATLDIRAVASTGTQRALRTSGRLSSEAGGEGYVNPMTITLSAVSASSSVTVNDYYVGLYSTASGAKLTDKASFLSNLQSRISSDSKNGILLHYNKPNNTYKIWKGGRWSSAIRVDGTETVRDGSTNLYTVIPRTFDGISAKWEVSITKDFGSKTMYTPIYAVDSSNPARTAFDPDFLIQDHYKANINSYSATMFFSQ